MKNTTKFFAFALAFMICGTAVAAPGWMTDNYGNIRKMRAQMSGLQIGQTSNCGLYKSSGTITIKAANGTDLSSSNPCCVGVPSSSGTGSALTLCKSTNVSFNDDDHASSNLTGWTFGATSGATFPESIAYINAFTPDNSSLYFYVTRKAGLITPASSSNIGDKDTSRAASIDDIFIIATGDTTSMTSKASALVASTKMTKTTIADDWTIAATNGSNGFGSQVAASAFGSFSTLNVEGVSTLKDNVKLPLGKKFYLDGGTNTYLMAATNPDMGTKFVDFYVENKLFFSFNKQYASFGWYDDAILIYKKVRFLEAGANVSISDGRFFARQQSSIDTPIRGENEYNSSLAYGVYGSSIYGPAVKGESVNKTGVAGKSDTFYGVSGEGGSGSYNFKAINASATDYGTSSSIRWKNNIIEIDHALDKVNALRGVYFDWDEAHGGAKHRVGFIAEEVHAQLPNTGVVSLDPAAPGYADGMDYAKMTPLLLQAIKEQQAIIVGLENRIQVLESK